MPIASITDREELDWMCRKLQAQRSRWRVRKVRLLEAGFPNQAGRIDHHLDLLVEIEVNLRHLMERYGRD